MNTGSKVALAAIIIIGVAVGGFLTYKKLQPKLGGEKPEADKGGTGSATGGASQPADKPTDMTKGGEVVGKETTASGGGAGGAMGGTAVSLGIFPNTVLKRGSGTGSLSAHKPSVIKLQTGLNKVGAGLDADGIFGAKTESALVKRTGKKTITVGQVEDAAKNPNVFALFNASVLSDNGKAFERGSNFAGIKIR